MSTAMLNQEWKILLQENENQYKQIREYADKIKTLERQKNELADLTTTLKRLVRQAIADNLVSSEYWIGEATRAVGDW